MIRLFSFLLCLGFLVAGRPASALLVTPLNDRMVSVTTSTKGDSKEAAIDEAKQQAVLAAAGRVLLEGNLIRADELLAKYLRTYAGNFVTGIEVLTDEFTGGSSVLKSRVFVNYEGLVADLKEKRFLYTPAYRPMFTAFLDERLDGAPIPQEPSRKLLENALVLEGAKIYGGTIDDPALGVNLLDDPLLLKTAVVSAERRNVELIVTGTSRTKLREERKLYFDTFYFYDCEMEVSLIRVDTGEVLSKATTQGSASDRDRATAVSTAIDRAAKGASAQLFAKYREFWPPVVQGKSDYELLLTGVDKELIGIVQLYLSGLTPDTKIEVKKRFNTSAVLSIKSSASRDAFIEKLRACSYPVLILVGQKEKGKFEVQVSG